MALEVSFVRPKMITSNKCEIKGSDFFGAMGEFLLDEAADVLIEEDVLSMLLKRTVLEWLVGSSSMSIGMIVGLLKEVGITALEEDGLSTLFN